MDTARNVLLGVLAWQADLLNATQSADACAAWANSKSSVLGDILVERGWISDTDRAFLDRQVERHLRTHGDSSASLIAIADDEVRRVLAALDDADIQQTLTGSTSAALASVGTPTPPSISTSDRYTLTRLHARGGSGWIDLVGAR